MTHLTSKRNINFKRHDSCHRGQVQEAVQRLPQLNLTIIHKSSSLVLLTLKKLTAHLGRQESHLLRCSNFRVGSKWLYSFNL